MSDITERLSAALANHYVLEHELGAGDLEHHRGV